MGRDARIPSLPETLSRCGQSLAEAREAGLTISSSSSDQPSLVVLPSISEAANEFPQRPSQLAAKLHT